MREGGRGREGGGGGGKRERESVGWRKREIERETACERKIKREREVYTSILVFCMKREWSARTRHRSSSTGFPS